jgi:hypothetical protein
MAVRSTGERDIKRARRCDLVVEVFDIDHKVLAL